MPLILWLISKYKDNIKINLHLKVLNLEIASIIANLITYLNKGLHKRNKYSWVQIMWNSLAGFKGE